jgi:hypothetical protein
LRVGAGGRRRMSTHLLGPLAQTAARHAYSVQKQ